MVTNLLRAHPAAGASSCLNILDYLLNLAVEEATADGQCDADISLCADPIVRIAALFLSQLLSYTAVVAACDAPLAQFLGGCSEMQPTESELLPSASWRRDSGNDTACRNRWRLWKMQREAVVLLLKCARSQLGPHVSSTVIFAISGALQVLSLPRSISHAIKLHFS